MRVLSLLLLTSTLAPAIALADHTEPTECSGEDFLAVHAPPGDWGLSEGRCLPLSYHRSGFCEPESGPADLPHDAVRLVVGDNPTGPLVIDRDLAFSLHFFPNDLEHEVGAAVLCPEESMGDDDLYLISPRSRTTAWSLSVEGDESLRALRVTRVDAPVGAGAPPNITLRRVERADVDMTARSNRRAATETIDYDARLSSDADPQTLVHFIEVDESGVPLADPSLGAAGDGWAEALRATDAPGFLRSTIGSLRDQSRPNIAGTFDDHADHETCWVAVAEGPDGAWTSPSDVVCVRAMSACQGGCSTAEATAPGPALLLLLLARRRRSA